MKRKNGFTLIELIAVLVILAILALIVTPLVMNIIRKARISADKRSIDAYGRSIELAIATYLLDNGDFPTSIEQLTIEYSGDEVVCSTTQLNSDSTVYLAGCTVGGRSIEEYTYGNGGGEEPTPTYTAYSVGDQVTYNNINYYVIKDSSTSEDSVTLLKAEPITSSEISSYLSLTEVSGKVNTSGVYATMVYYSADNCATTGNISSCSTDYTVSDIKQVVDIWKIKYANEAREARLLTLEELAINLGYDGSAKNCTGGCWYNNTVDTPSWVYNSNYYYWTMSTYEQSESEVWGVTTTDLHGVDVWNPHGAAIRPVIVLPKSALN